MATTSSAVAATMYTGFNIKDSSVSGIDVKSASLASTDFASTTKAKLAGAKGSRGTTGPNGSDALAQYSYDYANLKRLDTPITDNTGRLNYYRQSVIGTMNGFNRLSSTSIGSGTPVVQLSSTAGATDPITVTEPSRVIAMASVSLWHRADLGADLDDELDDVSVHSRAECQTLISAANASAPFTAMGRSTVVSSDKPQQVKVATVLGGASVGPGTYLVRLTCRAADRIPNAPTADHEWEFTQGNLVVLAAQE